MKVFFTDNYEISQLLHILEGFFLPNFTLESLESYLKLKSYFLSAWGWRVSVVQDCSKKMEILLQLLSVRYTTPFQPIFSLIKLG